MLHIQSFTFNPFQENTYLIYNEQKQCWFIDPGMIDETEQQEMVKFVEQNHLIPQAIINTHAHIDHILGIDFLALKYAIPFYLHEKEMPVLNNAGNTARMFGFQYDGVKTIPQFISEKEKIRLGEDELEVRFVPGHSPGSIAFYNEKGKWAISGDALFEGSIGRTDLLMGDYDTLIASIKKELFTLPGETAIYSGHGGPTTIDREKETNPYLR